MYYNKGYNVKKGRRGKRIKAYKNTKILLKKVKERKKNPHSSFPQKNSEMEVTE